MWTIHFISLDGTVATPLRTKGLEGPTNISSLGPAASRESRRRAFIETDHLVHIFVSQWALSRHPGHPICPLLCQECLSPGLISSLPGGEESHPPPAAADKRQTSGGELSRRRKRPSELLAVSGFNESWDGGAEEMPWSARPVLNYGSESDASGAWNRQVSLGRLLQTSRWVDDGDAGSCLLTQTCALHFIGWHFSDGDSSRRLECGGSLSQASTKMRQTASC